MQVKDFNTVIKRSWCGFTTWKGRHFDVTPTLDLHVWDLRSAVLMLSIYLLLNFRNLGCIIPKLSSDVFELWKGYFFSFVSYTSFCTRIPDIWLDHELWFRFPHDILEHNIVTKMILLPGMQLRTWKNTQSGKFATSSRDLGRLLARVLKEGVQFWYNNTSTVKMGGVRENVPLENL